MPSASNLDRRGFLRLAVATLAAPRSRALRAQSANPPNVVIILSDDQGYGDVGCYGTADAKTPRLDRLAASGARFTSFYANAPMCSPTRASLLTGRYPYRCGVPLVVDSAPGVIGLPGDEVTLAEVLKQQGYRTGLIGKWHLGSHDQSLPNQQGFDQFHGFHSGCVDYYSHRFYWGLGAGLPSFHDLWHNRQEVFDSGQYLTEWITQQAKRFITDSQDLPFFLVVSYNAPHYPMHAPPEYVERFSGLDPQRRMHLAMIAAMDDGIGEILDLLDASGRREDTLVFFQSDNGATIEDRAGLGGRNTPLRGYKFSLFEGGIRVPALMSWPGRIPAGVVTAEMAASMDVFPTIAKLCGAPLPSGRVIDGRDIWPLVTQGAKSPHEALFWKRHDQLAVRRGEWKLVLNGILALGERHRLQGSDRVFLSNLADDLAESSNRAAQHPRIAGELTEMCRSWELDVGNQ